MFLTSSTKKFQIDLLKLLIDCSAENIDFKMGLNVSVQNLFSISGEVVLNTTEKNVQKINQHKLKAVNISSQLCVFDGIS